jgi:hypothetical protein
MPANSGATAIARLSWRADPVNHARLARRRRAHFDGEVGVVVRSGLLNRCLFLKEHAWKTNPATLT